MLTLFTVSKAKLTSFSAKALDRRDVKISVTFVPALKITFTAVVAVLKAVNMSVAIAWSVTILFSLDIPDGKVELVDALILEVVRVRYDAAAYCLYSNV